MELEAARELAAQCWCEEVTCDTIMDHGLAEVFAEMLVREIEQAERRGFELMQKELQATIDEAPVMLGDKAMETIKLCEWLLNNLQREQEKKS